MQTYWINTREEDKEIFSKYIDKLKGRIPIYLQVTNGLVGGFEVTDWKKEEINVGFVYIQQQEDGNYIQNVYIKDNTDAGNIAIEILDSLLDNNIELEKQVDIKYVFDKSGKDPVMGILVLVIGEYGTLQEDLYSVYFTGHSIRKYGYMKEDYYKRNFSNNDIQENSNDCDSLEETNKQKNSSFIEFIKRIFKK